MSAAAKYLEMARRAFGDEGVKSAETRPPKPSSISERCSSGHSEESAARPATVHSARLKAAGDLIEAVRAHCDICQVCSKEWFTSDIKAPFCAEGLALWSQYREARRLLADTAKSVDSGLAEQARSQEDRGRPGRSSGPDTSERGRLVTVEQQDLNVRAGRCALCGIHPREPYGMRCPACKARYRGWWPGQIAYVEEPLRRVRTPAPDNAP
jgi:hypothetical protein